MLFECTQKRRKLLFEFAQINPVRSALEVPHALKLCYELGGNFLIAFTLGFVLIPSVRILSDYGVNVSLVNGS